MTRTIEIIEQYLSEIWKPFDMNNRDHIKEGRYLIRNTKGIIFEAYFHPGEETYPWTDCGGADLTPEFIVAYLDPADILPKEDK